MATFINPLLLDQSPVTTGLGRSYGLGASQANSALQPNQAIEEKDFSRHLSELEETNTSASASAPSAKAASTINAAPPEAKESSSKVASARISRQGADVPEDDDFTFDDMLDVINPLQHIPIVGTIYRSLTEDEIKPAARMVGDIGYGLLTGSIFVAVAGAVAGAVFEAGTGKTPETIVADALFGSEKHQPPATEPQATPVMLASAAPLPTNGSAPPATSISTATEPAPTQLAENNLPQLHQAPQSIASSAAGQPVNPVSGHTGAAYSAPLAVAALNTPLVQTGQKAPYGGVINLATSKNQISPIGTNTPRSMELAQNAAAQAPRIGNIIYTNPALKNAAKLAAQNALRQASAEQHGPTATNASTQTATTIQTAKSLATLKAGTAALALPGQEDTSTPKLGSLLGTDQNTNAALTASSGKNPLPPNLVQDMMLMALDKYKSTAGLAPSEMRLSNTSYNSLN